jgi:PAS domain S-box-containing protein
MPTHDELQEELLRYKQREEELRERVEELSDFLENAAMPIHWVDADGKIIWANQAELDLLGYSKGEFIGRSIADFHADPEAIKDILSRLRADETLDSYPAKLRARDGSLKTVLITSNVYRKNEKFIHTRCLIKDLTFLAKEEEERASLARYLEESESRLRMALDSTKLGTWDYNPVSGQLIWSEECRKMYGLDRDEVVTLDLFKERIYPGDREFVEAELEKAVDPQGDGAYLIKYRILRSKSNEIRWIQAYGQVYFDEDGSAVRFSGTVLDITAAKLAAGQLSKSEKLFKTIALNIPKTLILIIDKEHRFITVEGDIMQRLGYHEDNYEGKHPADVLPPGRYETAKPLFERALAGEKFSVETKSFEGLDFVVHLMPLRDETDEIYGALVMSMDITDIKHAEKKVAELAAIIESSDDAIIGKSLEGVITSWNASAQRMFGYTEAEVIGKSILMLIPEDRQDEEPLILARLKRGERVEHFETQRITKDKKIIDLSLTISPIKDSKGNIIGVSKIARDITTKKQEETRKNDFIAIVSHELKTPLTSVKSYIQLLLAKAKKEEKDFEAKALTRAEMQTNKMAFMINDFLNLARLEEGKMGLTMERFELHTLIEELAADAQFLAAGHHIQLVGCEEIMVYADRDKMSQIMINLLSNAVKYSPRGSTIRIGCEKEGGSVKVYVSDDGVGISKTDQRKLFERFYRVESEKMKTVSGFGIGLYLVSEILKYHGSKIQVDSEEGRGSTFWFELEMVE